jgi:hypothetical protein
MRAVAKANVSAQSSGGAMTDARGRTVDVNAVIIVT